MNNTSRSVTQPRAGHPRSDQSSNKPADNVNPSRRSASQVRTEAPSEPPNIYHAFDDVHVDPVPCGNTQYEFMLESEGTLGLFFKRTQYNQSPTYLDLDADAYRNGCGNTLYSVILRAHRLSGYVEDEEVVNRTTEVSETLSYGICVATYMKLRSVLCTDPNQRSKFLKRPTCPANFVLPAPFALAISQLGTIKVSGLTNITKVCPTLSEQAASNLMLPNATIWNPQAYTRAVEYAKKLGMKFEASDLSMKIGSSWWLLDSNEDDEMINFRCRLPEDNFTPQTTVIACIFANDNNGHFVNPIVDLTPLGEEDYGTMLRNPPPEFNVTCYLALSDESEEAWNLE